MNAAKPTVPLNDAELARLDELLETLSPDAAMLLEELDGFFAAIACSPETSSIPDLLPEVLGLDPGEPVEFVSAEQETEFTALLARHLRSVGEALTAGEGFSPILMHDDDGTPQGNLWAVGFLRGVGVHPDAWDEIEGDESTESLFEPFETLAEEIDFETGEVSQAVAADQRQELIEAMIEATFAFHESLEPQRRGAPTH